MKIAEKNVIAGITVSLQGNQLLFDNEVAATWTDDFTANCKVELTFTPQGSSKAKTVASGDILSEAGTLTLTVTDEFGNSATAEIKLTAVAVFGLENLQNKQLQVDQETNLLEGVTFAEGLTLAKVEAEQDGIRMVIANPNAFVPDYPGSVSIILTLTKSDGRTLEVRVDAILVKPVDYLAPKLEITDIFETTFWWYKNLNQPAQEFVKEQLLIANYASNWCRQPNTVNMML